VEEFPAAGRLDSASDLARRASTRLSWRLVDNPVHEHRTVVRHVEQRAIGAAIDCCVLRPDARRDSCRLFQLSGGRAVRADRSRHQVVETRLQGEAVAHRHRESRRRSGRRSAGEAAPDASFGPIAEMVAVVERVLVDRRISDRGDPHVGAGRGGRETIGCLAGRRTKSRSDGN